MGFLIRSQLRLVWWTAIPWIVAGVLAVGYYTEDASNASASAFPPEVVAVLLGCALGARLVSGEVHGAQGCYLRSLPVSMRRLFAVKLAVGLVVGLAALLLVAGSWEVGLVHLWISDEIRIESGGIRDVPHLLGFACAGFCCTAYLASAFERPIDSRWAGLAGGFSTLLGLHLCSRVFGAAPERPELPSQVGSPLVVLAACLVLLAGAYRLIRRRACLAASSAESVLSFTRTGDAPFLVAAHSLSVVVPAWVFVGHLLPDAGPFLGVSAVLFDLGCWVALGVVLLPWSIVEVRRRGGSLPRAAAAVTLCVTGLGYLVWRALRGTGPSTVCPRCKRRRLIRAGDCPRCGDPRLGEIEDAPSAGIIVWNPFGLPVVLLPLVLALGFVGSRVRLFHALQITVSEPEAWISLDGRRVGEGIVGGVFVRPIFGLHSSGSGSIGAFIDVTSDESTASTNEFSMPDILAGIEDEDDARNLVELIGPETRIGTGMDGLTAHIETVHAGVYHSAWMSSVSVNVKLEPWPVEISERVSALREILRQHDPLPEDLEPFVSGSDLFLRRLRESGAACRIAVSRTEGATRYVDDPQLRRRILEAIDRLLIRRRGLDVDPVGAAAATWAELDVEAASVPWGVGWGGQSEFGSQLSVDVGDSRGRYGFFYPELRALALVAAHHADEIDRRIAEGDLHAALVAGMSGDTRFFAELARQLDERPSRAWKEVLFGGTVEPDPFRFAAGLALLMLDRERAVEVMIRRLERTIDPDMLELLLVTGDERVLRAVEPWRHAPDLLERLDLTYRRQEDFVRRSLEALELAIAWRLEPIDLWEHEVLSTLAYEERLP